MLLEDAPKDIPSKSNCAINGERKIALQVLAQLGFNKLMHLPDYVMDMQTITHDFVLMGRSLKQEEEYAGLGG